MREELQASNEVCRHAEAKQCPADYRYVKVGCQAEYDCPRRAGKRQGCHYAPCSEPVQEKCNGDLGKRKSIEERRAQCSPALRREGEVAFCNCAAMIAFDALKNINQKKKAAQSPKRRRCR